MIVIGTLVALLVYINSEKKFNLSVKHEEKVRMSFAFGGLAGLACASVSSWFIYPELLSYPLLQRIANSGLIFYYGMFGFFLASASLLRIHKMDVCLWLNEIVPSVLILHAIGRIGCSLAGCCYGQQIAPITILGMHFTSIPAREIEALCLFTMFFLFAYKIKKHRLPLYMLSYSIIRFVIEFGRGDNRGRLIFQSISPAQTTSICIWIVLSCWAARIMLIRRFSPSGATTQKHK